MIPAERVIGEEGLERLDDGSLRLAMRLPWYRSLPFSVVVVASLAVDGVDIDLAQAMIEYDGERWPLTANGERTNTFWFIRDSAFLVVPGAAPAAGAHSVALTLKVSPPYIPGMTRINPEVAELHAA
jgi:hypothetical protein